MEEKLVDQPLYIVQSVGRDTRWSMAFLRTAIILSALSNLAFLVLFLVIVLDVTLVIQYGILWICYTAIQGGLLVMYLIAMLAYYMKNHQAGLPIWPHATSMVVLFGFVVLAVAYAVALTAQIVWLQRYPVNWLGTAAESSPNLADSTQLITFETTYAVGVFFTAIAAVGTGIAAVSAFYPTRIVNSLIAHRAAVVSLSTGPAPTGGAMVSKPAAASFSPAVPLLSHASAMGAAAVTTGPTGAFEHATYTSHGHYGMPGFNATYG